MPDFPTRSDLFRIERDEILSINPQLATQAVERAGTDANVLLAGSVASDDENTGQATRLSAGLFLDSARGAILDRLVFDRYGLVRNPAAAAIGTVNFSLPVVPLGAFTIPSGTLVAAANGNQYITTSATVFPTTTTGQVGQPLVSSPIRSVLAGGNQQGAVGTLTTLVSQVVLPNNVTGPLSVTNSLATAGAQDQESDDSLRSRARAFFTTARKGTLSAIQQGALAVPGVASATAIEITNGAGQPSSYVLLVVADQFTQTLLNYTQAGIPASYQAQSQQLAQNVSDDLLDVRGAGIFVQVQVANVALLPLVLAFTFVPSNSTPDQSAFLGRAAAVAYINSLGPGQSFVPSAMTSIFQSVPGLLVTGNEVVSPPGTQTAQITQVLRTTLALVTATSATNNVTLTSNNNPDAIA